MINERNTEQTFRSKNEKKANFHQQTGLDFFLENLFEQKKFEISNFISFFILGNKKKYTRIRAIESPS